MSNAGGAAVGAEHVGARRRRQVARRLREDLREQGSDVACSYSSLDLVQVCTCTYVPRRPTPPTL